MTQADFDEHSRDRAPAFAAARYAFGRLGRAALDIVLPPLCIGCQERISEHDALCPVCWRSIDFIRPPLCDRLGIPLPFDLGGPTLSAAAIADPPDWDRARAVARFDGVMRRMIHAFKFHDSHNGRRLFGRWLADAGGELLADADALVPVPLARSRLLYRRFNQAQIIAAEVGRIRRMPVLPLALVRSRSTAHQVGLSRLQRARNVAGAFTVPAGSLPAVAGKAIVLVDDVITSGATASAAAAALRRAGARRVDVLVLALVSDAYS